MFFKHLYILLWKNFILFRRDLTKLFVIAMVPFLAVKGFTYFMDFISTPPRLYPACNYSDVPLLSSGVLTFAREFICLEEHCSYFHEPSKTKTVGQKIRHLFTSGRWRKVVREITSFLKNIDKLDQERITADLYNFTSRILYGINHEKCLLNLKNLLNTTMLEKLGLEQDTSVDFRKFVRAATYFDGSSDELYETHVFRNLCGGLLTSFIVPEEHAKLLCNDETKFNDLFREAVESISYSDFFNEVSMCRTNLEVSRHLRHINATLPKDLENLYKELEKMEETKKYFNDFFDEYITLNKVILEEVFCSIRSPKPKNSRKSTSILTESCDQLIHMKNNYKFLHSQINFQPDNEFTRKIASNIKSSVEEFRKFLNFFILVEQGMRDVATYLRKSQLLNNVKIILPFWYINNPSTPLKVVMRFLLNKQGIGWDEGGVLDLATSIAATFVMADNCIEIDNVTFHDDENIIYENITTFFANVVFESGEDDNILKYRIRQLNSISESVDDYWDEGRIMKQENKYIKNGFVFIQDLIDHAYIKHKTGKDNVGVVHQHFPQTCLYDDGKESMYWPLFVFLTLPWIFSILKILTDIAVEHELNLKDYMKVMGMSDCVYWISWIITALIIFSVPTALIVYTIMDTALFVEIDPIILFIFFMLYVTSMLTKANLVIIYFRKGSSAMTAGAMLLAFYLEISSRFEQKMVKNTSYCIIGMTSSIEVWSQIVQYQLLGQGVTWSNILKHPMSSSQPSIAICLLLTFYDIVFNVSLLLFVTSIVSGSFKESMKSLFMCNSKSKVEEIDTIRTEHQSVLNVNQDLNLAEDNFASNASAEEVKSTDIEQEDIGVSVVDLVKKYGWRNKRTAVNHLTVNFYKDQITAFLGHNGAGKSTTMNIMAGLLKPTSGTIYINGMDIQTSMTRIRKDLSICPQHNVLFDGLTVDEHMYFFGTLRGLSKDFIAGETKRLLGDLNLHKKFSTVTSKLSGGMKRILSIGLAYLGSPKVIILDEPTSGVDTFTMRQIWNLIKDYRSGHTTIITTHSMDEADIVSDKIVVIWKGALAAAGTSMELKKNYGKGYRLFIEIQSSRNEQNNENKLNQTGSITKVIQHYIPLSNLEMENVVSNEIVYSLPLDDSSQAAYLELFKDLDRNKTNLKIQNFGISSPGLEEVFVRINELAEIKGVQSPEAKEFEPYPTYTKRTKLFRPQMYSMLAKRFHYFKRSKSSIVTQILAPLASFYLYLFFNYGDTSFFSSVMNEVLIHPWLMARPSNQPIETFIARENHLDWDPSDIENSFLTGSGMSVRCLKDFHLPGFECKDIGNLDSIAYPPNYNASFNRSCECNNASMQCSEVDGELPLKVEVGESYVMHNLTHHDVTDYLLKTTLENMENRYGGFEFISKSQNVGGNISEEITEFLETFVNFGEVLRSIENMSLDNLQGPKDGWKTLNIEERYLVRIWYNNYGKLALTSFVNILSNALMSSKDLHIITIHAPRNLFELLRKKGSPFNTLAIFLVFSLCLSIVAASFVIFSTDERMTGFKHLQIVSGVYPLAYWIANFLWDMVIYFIMMTLFILGVFIYLESEALSTKQFGDTFLLSICFGFAVVPFNYLVSFFFKDGGNAFLAMLAINLYCIVRALAYCVMKFFAGVDIRPYGARTIPPLTYGLGLFGMFGGRGGRDLQTISAQAVFLPGNRTESQPKIHEKCEDYLIIQGAFFLLGLVASRGITNIGNRIYNFRVSISPDLPKDAPVDEDVKVEESRIASNIIGGDLILVRNVKKVYSPGLIKSFVNFLFGTTFGTVNAVKGVSFGVRRAECFGLLGVNGAGKTTVFKMVTGEIYATSGDVTIDGLSITKIRSKAQQHLGYCPQFDAFCSLLTVREHLVLFTRIRGVPNKHLKEVVTWAMSNFGLQTYSSHYPRQLSGGNRRKLSVALSIIGDTDLICLDEPTTGVDPHARSFIWKAVYDANNADRAVIFTSHSMEECEALCSRVTIMVAGRLKCLGSLQHIKTKFSKGYIIKLKLNPRSGILKNTIREAKKFMNDVMPDAQLVSTQYSMLVYQAPLDSKALPSALENLNSAKKQGICEDFVLNQTTLEQVFVDFAEEALKEAAK